tara:strand:- start:1865 stop:2167 length:303 start_codon:yes stop_codon:yes gene_type:complete
MVKLDDNGIERFRGKPLSSLEGIIDEIQLFPLFAAESRLIRDGFEGGLPYYVAMQYHLKGKLQREIGEELGLHQTNISDIMKYWGIPSMTQSERREHFGG